MEQSKRYVNYWWRCRRKRFVLLTVGIIAVPLALAARNPSLAAGAYALTGATGVCIVCYTIPVLAHFKLLLWGDGEQPDAEAQSVLLPVDEDAVDDTVPVTQKEMYSERPSTIGGWLVAVVVPLVVLLIGCSLSGLALWSSLT